MFFLVSNLLYRLKESMFGSTPQPAQDLVAPEPSVNLATCYFAIRRIDRTGTLDLSYDRRWMDEDVFQACLPVNQIPAKGGCLCLLIAGENFHHNYRVIEVIQSVYHGFAKNQKVGSIPTGCMDYRIYIEQIQSS